MPLMSINPATGELIAEWEQDSDSKVEQILESGMVGFSEWRTVSIGDRSQALLKIADELRSSVDALAELMTREMGKPVTQAKAEIGKCAWVCEYYAQSGPEFIEPIPVETSATNSYVRFDPIGPVLTIMPWNFPFWQVFRAVAPLLMAGNTVVLKHASNVSGCAIAIDQLCRKAGLPEGVFSTLLVTSSRVADIIRDNRIAAVTLTGSEAAGRSVAAVAGQSLKKAVLELGGSDPFIVLPDADIQQAAQQGALARCLNSGQSCIAAKRFLVCNEVADQFQEELVKAMRDLSLGDPFEEATEIGPLAREDLVDELHQQVTVSVERGATLVTGGQPLTGDGCFYPATVLADVQPGMSAFDEELFGPVAAVISVEDAEHAIRLANQSRFGLGASIWTEDLKTAESLARQIESGAVFINDFTKSDPRLPFGGVKDSGFGRELSDFGIREFVNVKTVVVK